MNSHYHTPLSAFAYREEVENSLDITTSCLGCYALVMKQTTGIIIGIIVILALGMLGYAYIQKPVVMEQYTDPTPPPAPAGAGIQVTASSSLYN